MATLYIYTTETVRGIELIVHTAVAIQKTAVPQQVHLTRQ